MKSLKIYSSKERLPKNGEGIWLFSDEKSWHDCQSVEFVNVEYTWLELDPTTKQWDGTSYSYTGKKRPTPNCKLVLLDGDGMEMLEPFLYARTVDMDRLHASKGRKATK